MRGSNLAGASISFHYLRIYTVLGCVRASSSMIEIRVLIMPIFRSRASASSHNA